MKKYCYEHPRPAVTADILIFSFKDEKTEVLLIRRGSEPFKGNWAFPGGFMDIDETVEACAYRELEEETTLKGIDLHEIGCFSKTDRDPRGRTISIAFYGIADKSEIFPRAEDDAKDAGWFDVDKLPLLAFDHKEMLTKALVLLKKRKEQD